MSSLSRATRKRVGRLLNLTPLPEEMMGLNGPDFCLQEDSVHELKDGQIKAVNLYRKWPVKVRAQGRTNRCSGAGSVALMDQLRTKQAAILSRVTPEPLSMNELYWHARRNKAKDEGAIGRDIVNAMINHGSVPEDLWPDKASCLERPAGLDSVPHFKLLKVDRLDGGASELIDGVKRLLSVENLGGWFGMHLYDGPTEEANRYSYFTMPGRGDRSLGWHWVNFAGWFSPRPDKSLGYMIIQNSWGAMVGTSGLQFVPFDYIKEGLIRVVWTVPEELF